MSERMEETATAVTFEYDENHYDLRVSEPVDEELGYVSERVVVCATCGSVVAHAYTDKHKAFHETQEEA